MAKKIFLSPSNQTDNTYAYGGTNEAVQCGRIAEAAKAALLRCGFEVKVNHMGTLKEKVSQSNAWPADLHIPIHTNAANGKVTGTRMFYYSEGSNSYRACKAIYDVLAPITPGTSENIRAYPSLYEMNMTTASSVYIEVEFHDVASAAKWIIEHPTEIGEAICKGVCNFYGVTYKAAAAAQTPAEEKQTDTGNKAEARYHALKDVPDGAYRETLDKLISAGIIKGREGTGEDLVLDLGEDAVRMLVYLDRAGVFGSA